MGPCLVTPDDVPHPDSLALRCTVNGGVRQQGSTADWVLPPPRLLSGLSRMMPLEPGDVVGTGTPPPREGADLRPLRPGDVVVVEVEGLGRLENPVVAA